MHLVSGHFNNLEFANPQMSFPFVRQLAGVALRAVNFAKAQNTSISGPDALPELQQTVSLDILSPAVQVRNSVLDNSHANFLQQDFDEMDFDYEEWGTLVGWPEPDGLDPNTGLLC